MDQFHLFTNQKVANVFIEHSAPKGVKRVAETLCSDITYVTQTPPLLINHLADATEQQLIFIGTYGTSETATALEQLGLIDCSSIYQKRECYLIKTLDTPFSNYPEIKKVLVILGSDKRGSIYGMFRLSELCGISPLVFWGDVAPIPQNEVILSFKETIISKEPSVKYRGFFINDEWPAFGNWCLQHYGDVNAKAYDKIFELLLRLKGNYLWPAMWNSSFWQDGPGLENALLADEYGVIIGTSHHEPLCRAGVEWQRQYEQYGDDSTWSFVTNSSAITSFWRDGIQRSKELENVITIGMRGENDSLLMKEDATLQDNINVLKEAITVQNRLIKEVVHENLSEVPRMLAIYKEVEDFYFGTDDCKGLKDFEEIQDVILLLSDDNFGTLRAIPQLTDTPHPGGYGIYYHLDYHGAPYSYEWLNFSTLPKMWEQLTMAYEYGIHEMWIANVGDIKGHEYPLSFFMNLAYDFDKWGTSHFNSAAEFTREWIGMQFTLATEEQKAMIQFILDGYTQLTTWRLPESLHPHVYQNNYHEIDQVMNHVETIQSQTKWLRTQLHKHLLNAYDSMIYYPVMASLNAISLNLCSGMNHVLAQRGSLAANDYLPMIEEKVALDYQYVHDFHHLLDGKWHHMMSSAHTGFRNWDDYDWTYPQGQIVYPIPYPKIMISFRGASAYHLGLHWQHQSPLINEEMMRPDVNKILLDIDSRGSINFTFSLRCDATWLSFSKTEGTSSLEQQSRLTIEIMCDRSQLHDEQTASVKLDFTFENGEKKEAHVMIKASNEKNTLYSGAFLETEHYICMSAAHFDSKTDVDGMGFSIIPQLGRNTDAIKSFPVTKNWETDETRPFVEYRFIAKASQEYTLAFYLSPRNPLVKKGFIKGAYSINHSKPILFDIVTSDYHTEWQCAQWSFGVTNNMRIVTTTVTLKEGLNTLQFYAANPHVILENIVLYPVHLPIQPTHLAPPESYRF